MSLKLSVKDLAEVPEELHTFYEERDGQWVLKLSEPVVPKSKLTEFRNTNIDLMKKVKDYEEKLKSINLDEYHELKKKMKELEEKDLLAAGKIDEIINRREMEIKRAYEDKLNSTQRKLKEMETLLGKYRNRLSTSVIDAEVQKAVLSVAKPKKSALPDILLRARQVWKVSDDGEPMPLDDKGEVIKTENGPLTFKEWAEKLVSEAPHLFDDSRGGGAAGGAGGGAVKTISRHDKDAFAQNLEEIAAGKVRVAMD